MRLEIKDEKEELEAPVVLSLIKSDGWVELIAEQNGKTSCIARIQDENGPYAGQFIRVRGDNNVRRKMGFDLDHSGAIKDYNNAH